MADVAQVHVVEDAAGEGPVQAREPPRLLPDQGRDLREAPAGARRRLVQQPRRDRRQQRHVSRVREEVPLHRRVQVQPRLRHRPPRAVAEIRYPEHRRLRVPVRAVYEDLPRSARRGLPLLLLRRPIRLRLRL